MTEALTDQIKAAIDGGFSLFVLNSRQTKWMPVVILSANKKIKFANQLRGIAAVLVVLSHICGAFWSVRNVVGYYSGTPPVVGAPPFVSGYISNQYLNFGALGVAVFFMISGFVIPMSLGRMSKARFIVGRFLRIYPTYIAAFSVGMLAVWMSCMYWGKDFMWNYQAILTNMFLVHTFTDLGSIDLVNWTLAVELKFYIVICLMGGLVVAGRVWPLLVFSLAVFGLNKLTKSYIGIELMFVSFMMMGVLFNYLFRGIINVFVCAAACTWIMALFLIGWESGGVSQNYVYGFAIFATSYAFRDKFVDIRVLDFFSDISYPLYVVHSLVSYGIMRLMIEEGFPVSVATSAAMVCAVSIAYGVHRLVEKPTMHMGKKLMASSRLAAA